MDLYKLTKEEIEKLTKKRDDKQLELNILEKKEISQIWTEELDELELLYKKDLINYESNTSKKGKKSLKIKKK